MSKFVHYGAQRSAGHWILLRKTPNCIEYQKDFNFRFYLVRRNILIINQANCEYFRQELYMAYI